MGAISQVHNRDQKPQETCGLMTRKAEFSALATPLSEAKEPGSRRANDLKLPKAVESDNVSSGRPGIRRMSD
jgi:hypothetical protein